MGRLLIAAAVSLLLVTLAWAQDAPVLTRKPADAASDTITGGDLHSIRDDHYAQYKRGDVHAPGTAAPTVAGDPVPASPQPQAQQQAAQADARAAEQQAAWQQQQGEAEAAKVGAAHRRPLRTTPPPPLQPKVMLLQRRQLRQEGRPAAEPIPVLTVVALTLVMAAAAGLGALPFFFVRSLSKRWAGLATAVACGVMFAASFDLVHEGQPYGGNLVVLGVLLGTLFIRASHGWLEQYDDVQFENLRGGSARKTVLMVGIMAAHALGEGCGVGVSFVGERGWAQGVLTTLAIGVHNVPEGMAKATVLVGQGVSPRSALWWSVLTCLPQPLVAVPSFVFVDTFRCILPVALGFAAGCMVWMVFAELLPDALEAAPRPEVASAATLAAAALEGCRMFFESFETVSGTFAVPVPGDVRLAWPALALLLPALGGAMAAGGLLGSSGMPVAVGSGLAAAIAAWSGVGALARQALHAADVPAAHTLSAAVAGATAVLLLRRSLLRSAAAAAAGLAPGKGKGGNGHSGSSGVDLEAAPAKDRGGYATVSGSIPFNGGAVGYGGGEADLCSAAYMRRGGAGAGSAPTSPSKARGSPRPRQHGSGQGLPPPQLAARGAMLAALATFAVPQGWRLAEGLLLLGGDVSSLVLPSALMLGVLGVAASGVLGRGFGSGALAGLLPGAAAAGAALHAVLQTPPGLLPEEVRRRFGYPLGLAPTIEALAGGALCMAALLSLAAATLLSPRRARGGFVLGLLLAAGVHFGQSFLCLTSSSCLRDVAI